MFWKLGNKEKDEKRIFLLKETIYTSHEINNKENKNLN
jgi:hypothetical protein